MTVRSIFIFRKSLICHILSNVLIYIFIFNLTAWNLASLTLAADQDVEFFESKIRPILAEHCYVCHNSLGQSDGGLVLDWRGGVQAGSDNGAVVLPGDPKASKLLAVIKHEIDGLEMPQGGVKLSDAVIADFEKWIRDGLVDPRHSSPTKEQYEAETSWSATFARRLDWWSLQNVAPKFPDQIEPEFNSPNSRVDTPSQIIDHFIERDLNAAGLSLQKKATPAQLVRRLYQNLIGLPPSESELRSGIESIEVHKSITSLVDELLARPEFGEKWARHWMDWVRYADSHGSEGDPSIDNAWLYRDYLVRALNDNVSYDQMLREHIAGDLIENPRINQTIAINESMVAMAHWRMVFHGFFPTDALDEKVRFIDDQINVFSKAFLGLTVSCSRCHDHKFDPISQEDYYALFAVLNNNRPARDVIDTQEVVRLHSEKLFHLKQLIREELCREWLTSRDKLIHDLVTRTEFPANPSLFHRTLGLWKRIKQSREQGAELATIRSENPPGQPPNSSVAKRWEFRADSDAESWFASGFGLITTDDRRPRVSSAGEFRIPTGGEAVLTEILPSGIYSGLLSTKHAARLSSPDIRVEPRQQIWALVRGGGDATLRGVVQDYPRMGGIYPFTKPGGEWHWERIDMTYWEGDSMHIEFAHAQDTAMPLSDKQRSWFGIRDIVVSQDSNPPQSALQQPTIMDSILKEDANATLETLANLVADEVFKAINAWNAANLTDEQAILLDEFLHAGLLSNRLDQFSTERSKAIQQLLAEYRRLESEIKAPTRIPSIETTPGRTQQLYVRGDHKNPAQTVPPNFLSALPSEKTPHPFDRLRLANELLRTENPIVHRVFVNRIWHHLFGRGIVSTPDNFGKLGDIPTNQELLDTLVMVFRDQNTSIKSLIKTMVLSDVWQSDSLPSEEANRIDPDNLLWSHTLVRRMDAEAIRDNLLSISGELDHAKFGPPVGGDSNRRGVYIRVQRNSLDPFLRAFDFPEPFATTGRRDSTNVPAQSLAMMNDPQVTRLINSWAKGLLEGTNANLSNSQRLEKMFVQSLSRSPSPKELELLSSYFDETVRSIRSDRDAAESILAAKVAAEKRKENLISVARDRFFSRRGESMPPQATAHPVVRFDFDKGLTDDSGTVTLTLHNGAKIVEGALIVDGQGYAVSSALPVSLLDKTLTEKTLEAWVQVDGFSQRGGGVVSIQSPDGARFDSIVLGEQTPGRWMAGSEFFSRTKPFNGPEEIEADKRAVQIAIAYRSDGTIQAYRDGKPYGQAYQSGSIQRFDPNQSILSFGLRHLPASNGKMLVGKIVEARLYDRALNDSEIESSFQSFQYGFNLTLLPELLSSTELAEWQGLEKQIPSLHQEWKSKMQQGDMSPEMQAISDIGRSIFMMKEFLFIR